MNALSPVEIDRKTETLIPEKPLLHPEQQKVIDLLEEYPAKEFRLCVFTTYEAEAPGNPIIFSRVFGDVCFCCVAAWTAETKTTSGFEDEIGRLTRVAALTSDRARLRMWELVTADSRRLPKSECIALVRDIFMDVGA